MTDLSHEWYQTCMVAWCCFAIGIVAGWQATREKLWQWRLIGVWVARLSILMCPISLTREGVELVRTNQQLAVMLAAKKAEGVNDERVIRLAAADVVESRGGGRLERHVYTDGRAGFHRSMPPIPGRIGRGTAVDGSAERANWQSVGPVLELPKIARSRIY